MPTINININIYFCFEKVLRSFVWFFIFLGFYHALIVMNVLIDFILICIYYVVGLMLLTSFESLIYGMFITRFTGLNGMYDEYCFLDFLLYWLCFLHFKNIQIYNITKILAIHHFHQTFLDWVDTLEVVVPALP